MGGVQVTNIDTNAALDEAAKALDAALRGVPVNTQPALLVALSILGAGILIAKAIGQVADAITARANQP